MSGWLNLSVQSSGTLRILIFESENFSIREAAETIMYFQPLQLQQETNRTLKSVDWMPSAFLPGVFVFFLRVANCTRTSRKQNATLQRFSVECLICDGRHRSVPADLLFRWPLWYHLRHFASQVHNHRKPFCTGASERQKKPRSLDRTLQCTAGRSPVGRLAASRMADGRLVSVGHPIQPGSPYMLLRGSD